MAVQFAPLDWDSAAAAVSAAASTGFHDIRRTLANRRHSMSGTEWALNASGGTVRTSLHPTFKPMIQSSHRLIAWLPVAYFFKTLHKPVARQFCSFF